jgi:L-seryl-tRNA(Ser) seleniumtransferase
LSALYRALPATDRLLEEVSGEAQAVHLPRRMLKELVNAYLDHLRREIRSERIRSAEELALERLKPEALAYIARHSRPKFRRVINATGVVVHTNLGRSLLSEAAMGAVQQACGSYSNLEFDLETGKRGSRYALVEELLCELTGAEAGLVVNNNAAAVLLMLDTLAKGKEVVVSRGELVEIGGSFRIPEVMAKSGALLREVGATNRTHLKDYSQAIGPETAALLKAHTSNYRIVGFHKEVDLAELVDLGREHALPVLEDLGSGNLFHFPEAVRMDEPTVQSRLKKGVSVVTFSGDKILGGPQAGLILGRREFIDPIKKNPLNRALRIDKMTLAALEATLRQYKDPESAAKGIPTLRMICTPVESLRGRATRLASKIRRELGHAFAVSTRKGSSRVGGGASPELDLPTQLVRLEPRIDLDVERLRELLLHTDPPLVGRVEEDGFCLDPRTLLGSDISQTVDALQQALAQWERHPYGE